MERLSAVTNLRRAWILVALLAACADDAPIIDQLEYTPTAADVGTASTINGAVMFYGVAHASEGQARWVFPDGQTVESDKTPVMNVKTTEVGGTTSRVEFKLALTPPMPGLYRFELWVIDFDGRASNRVSGVVRVDD